MDSFSLILVQELVKDAEWHIQVLSLRSSYPALNRAKRSVPIVEGLYIKNENPAVCGVWFKFRNRNSRHNRGRV